QEPDLTPKDIIVMVADIDKYTPYIRAVFGQNVTLQTANFNLPFLPQLDARSGSVAGLPAAFVATGTRFNSERHYRDLFWRLFR
ncbi:exodeoxyribonuclease V subunit gamma, partial [Aggregatibacter actinomycetemcomitans]|uniref:exodeoxyribonuclease V subunit gamma n=1 Tax=Aggregatibacter actinomycetemcomitans TaxID=714 RepID=UPI0011785431